MLAILIGSVAQWLTVVGLVAAAWALWRGGGGTALSTLQTANRVLEKRVSELEAQQKRDLALIAELRGKTDVTQALTPLIEWTSKHETRAQERHEGELKVLMLVAERLGPDNGS